VRRFSRRRRMSRASSGPFSRLGISLASVQSYSAAEPSATEAPDTILAGGAREINCRRAQSAFSGACQNFPWVTSHAQMQDIHWSDLCQHRSHLFLAQEIGLNVPESGVRKGIAGTCR